MRCDNRVGNELGRVEEIKRVLVTRDGKLIGIVSRADLVRMVARSASPEPEAIAEEERRRQELRGQFPRRDPLN
jgi:hypothetical protein